MRIPRGYTIHKDRRKLSMQRQSTLLKTTDWCGLENNLASQLTVLSTLLCTWWLCWTTWTVARIVRYIADHPVFRLRHYDVRRKAAQLTVSKSTAYVRCSYAVFSLGTEQQSYMKRGVKVDCSFNPLLFSRDSLPAARKCKTNWGNYRVLCCRPIQ